MKEKRGEQRLLCAELVQVTYRDQLGRLLRRVANLEDISTSGLCLASEIGIPEGTSVSVHHGIGQFCGIVRYCVDSDLGFLLGVEFEPGCRWSTQNFRPEHLLDPRRLCEDVLSRYHCGADAKAN